jgi:hypothetical protein
MQIKMLREDLRDQTKQIVAGNLPLTGDEAAKFSIGFGAPASC